MKILVAFARRYPVFSFVVVAVGLARLLAGLAARRFPATLPTPTGPYRIGRITHDWVDAAREDVYARRRGARRELSAWIWYPAAPAPSAKPGGYLPGWWGPSGLLWGFNAGQVRIHAVPDAPVSRDRAGYSVLVFSPPAFPPLYYTAMFEELASHGYVVVGLSHTYEMIPISVFADGRIKLFNPATLGGALRVSARPHAEDVRARAAVVDFKAADLRSAVDQLEQLNTGSGPLAGRLDLARLGVFGHSLGGSAAAEVCRLDRRCRAGANLDGGLWSEAGRIGLSRPFLQMFAEHREYVQPCADSVRQKIFTSIEYCRADRAFAVGGWHRLHTSAQPGYSVQVRGAGHSSFMDWSLLPLLPWSPTSRLLGTIAGRRMWRVTSDYLLAFFGRHLSDASAPLLDGPSPDHPEVVLETPNALFNAGEP